MPKNKSKQTESEFDNFEQEFSEPNETPQEELVLKEKPVVVKEQLVVEEKPKEPAKVSKSKQSEEIVFLEPYGSSRLPYTGKFLRTVENLFTVAETEDGRQFSFPYVHELHKDLKAGDEITF